MRELIEYWKEVRKLIDIDKFDINHWKEVERNNLWRGRSFDSCYVSGIEEDFLELDKIYIPKTYSNLSSLIIFENNDETKNGDRFVNDLTHVDLFNMKMSIDKLKSLTEEEFIKDCKDYLVDRISYYLEFYHPTMKMNQVVFYYNKHFPINIWFSKDHIYAHEILGKYLETMAYLIIPIIPGNLWKICDRVDRIKKCPY